MKRRAKSFIPLLLTAFIIVLDRFTKQIVVASMEYAESIPVLGNTVRWTYIHNYGMAFGLDIIGVNILGWISLIAAIVILFILFRTDNRTNGTRWILAAILGGAIGNTYDRLVYGYVIDFIDVDLPAWMGMDRWPVFNIADSAVSVGVVLLVISMFLPHRDKEDIAADEYVSDEPKPDFPLSGPEAPAAGELRNDRSVDPAVSGPEAPAIGSIDQEAEAEDPETEDGLKRLGEEFDSRTSELKDTSDIEENTEDEREKPE